MVAGWVCGRLGGLLVISDTMQKFSWIEPGWKREGVCEEFIAQGKEGVCSTSPRGSESRLQSFPSVPKPSRQTVKRNQCHQLRAHAHCAKSIFCDS